MASLKKRYADALLELSKEDGSLEKDLEEIVFVRNILEDADVQDYLVHPHVLDSDKKHLFQKAFSDKVSNNLMGFFCIMVDNKREYLIVPVLKQYIEEANKILGKIEARVVSANELTDKQIDEIAIKLSKLTDMEISIKTTVDPDLIAGFYVLLDGHIYDGSLRNKLNNMKESLKRGSIEWK